MSKYTDMLADKYRCHCGTCEVQKGNVSEEECKICSHYAIREALQIADRLEQADVQAHYLDRMRQTTKRAGYADGYIQAVKDVKGDNNDNNK